MDNTVLIAIIGVISSLFTSLIAIIPTIISNRRKTQESLENTDKEIKRQIEATNERIDVMAKSFEDYKVEAENRNNQTVRVRILRFNEEVCDPNRRYQTKDCFEQAIIDCDTYARYCAQHEDFKNGIAEIAIKNIREVYEDCLKHDKFGKQK